jgi:hypothetical protein
MNYRIRQDFIRKQLLAYEENSIEIIVTLIFFHVAIPVSVVFPEIFKLK